MSGMPDSRIKKSIDSDRLSREGQEKLNERELANPLVEDPFDFFEEFEALPKVPVIPGWHCCWLSTTHNTDTPYARMRIGYQPVAADPVLARGEEGSEGARVLLHHA